MIIRRTTTKLDGGFFVLNVLEHEDKSCRAEVIYSPVGRAESSTNVQVMVQERLSVERAVAAIARDFSTFATRSLASLPTIGELADPDAEEED